MNSDMNHCFCHHNYIIILILQEKYNSMISLDKKVKLEMLSFQAPKIRLLRSFHIESETMQVLFYNSTLLGRIFYALVLNRIWLENEI